MDSISLRITGERYPRLQTEPHFRPFAIALHCPRAQVRRMVRYESVITAVIGGLLGTGVGLLFGFLVTRLLGGLGLGFALPLGQLLMFLVLAVAVGVIAAVVPARRGAAAGRRGSPGRVAWGGRSGRGLDGVQRLLRVQFGRLVAKQSWEDLIRDYNPCRRRYLAHRARMDRRRPVCGAESSPRSVVLRRCASAKGRCE